MVRKTGETQWSLRLGGLAPKIDDQLRSQGLTVPHVEQYQKMADAIVVLYMGDVLPEGEMKKLRKRLIKSISGRLLKL